MKEVEWWVRHRKRDLVNLIYYGAGSCTYCPLIQEHHRCTSGCETCKDALAKYFYSEHVEPIEVLEGQTNVYDFCGEHEHEGF